jgi:rubredoxin
MSDRFVCPVCGFPDLLEPPWSNDSPSDEICPSCGTHFGYDDVAGGDAAKREVVYRDRRSAWRANGCRWFSTGRKPPDGWDPEAQLQTVED